MSSTSTGISSAAFLLVATGAAWASPVFTIINPVGPTYDAIQLNDVSGDGRFVIGQMSNVATFRATRWTADGLMTADLGLLSGRPYSDGIGLSFEGSIGLANAINGSYFPQPFRWTSPSTRLALPFLAGTNFAYGESMSSDGSVIAGWTNIGNVQRLWRWTVATGTTLLPLPSGTYTSQFDLQSTRMLSSDGRYIASRQYRFDSVTGAILDIGALIEPGQPAGGVPSVTSISGDGATLTGYQDVLYSDGSYANGGFIWTPAGGMENLGYLTHSRNCFPRWISADGTTVLGTYDGFGFIWKRSTGLVDFSAYLSSIGVDTRGMTRLQFIGISDDGRTIVGEGTSAAGPRRGWVLTIPQTCIGDFNGDGGIDGTDVEAFFAAWEAGASAADVNQDGGVDGADVATFFAAWESGGCG